MRIAVDALWRVHEMARQGAELAARRLGKMTGLETTVEVTRLNFVRREAVRRSLSADAADGRAGIRAELSDGVEGTSLVLFDRASALRVVELLTDGWDDVDQSLVRSTIVEAAQIVDNGFVDGWANALETTIDVSVPEYVVGTDGDAFLREGDAGGADEGLAVAFESRVETAGEAITFRHYFLPAPGTVAALVAVEGDGGIDLADLAGFDRMAQRGADTAAGNFTTMTGIDVAVDVQRIDVVAVDSLPGNVTDDAVSVGFDFEGLPSGTLLFIFGEWSARKLAAAALGEAGLQGEDGLDALGRDTLCELSNIMASGMLDGWANLLETTIDHSPPAFSDDARGAVVDLLIEGLSAGQELAFVFDTHIEAAGTAIDFDILLVPTVDGLAAALDAMDRDRVEGTPTRAETALPDREYDPDHFGDIETIGT